MLFVVEEEVQIELEQMDSADPPLGVRRLHSGRHHQRRYCGTGEVQ